MTAAALPSLPLGTGGAATPASSAPTVDHPMPPPSSTRYKKQLGPVLLRLKHVSKTFMIAKSDEVVHALEDICLCEEADDIDDDVDGSGKRFGLSAANSRSAMGGPTSSASSVAQTAGLLWGSGGVAAETGDSAAPLPPRLSDTAGQLSRKQRYFPPIRQGEFVMIRGPSGGGKSTLLNIIGTIDSPTQGAVELLGQPITAASDDDYLSDLRLKHIGFVFQTFNLLSTMSAMENVELPMTLSGELSEQDRRRRAKQLLSLVGLRNRAGHLPSELSGGEQQRTTIARALANNPEILLLDEPTGDLDTNTTIDIMDLLMRINYLAGTTCIMVTHNPDVECYADRILYVEDGRFVRQVVNVCPVPLVKEEYAEYLKRLDMGGGHDVMSHTRQAPSTPPAPRHGGGGDGTAATSPVATPREQVPQANGVTRGASFSHGLL